MDHPAPPTDALPYQSTNEPSETSAVYPTLSRFSDRLATFENSNWPSKHSGKIVQLASIGFFYTGTGDFVKCFQCGLGLSQWESGDDPQQEHESHNNGCNYFNKFLKLEPCIYHAADGRSALSRLPCDDPADCEFCRWEREAENRLPVDTTDEL
ncbi:baculoviral IAP repeat-containing protein 7-B-like [Anopheles aquasalis]|uniref:Putative inhibitor of apoptosis domain protein n=1 Tax=Anopheles aquasalis TaxID=42839 RepID=T1DP17_ANOAQ|nr:baculoviral IAP repeat-containing protein 7-B-like [Anopheles aquasalis]